MTSSSPSGLTRLRDASKFHAEVRVANFFSLSKSIEHLRAETEAGRPPLLVLGSGLLSQTYFHSVASWAGLLESLVETTATTEAPIQSHLIGLSPTTTWELIVQRFARASNLGGSASDKPERAAQRALAELVRERLRRDRPISRAEIFPGVRVKRLLSPRLAGVVSLNFTLEPFSSALSGVQVSPEGERSRRVLGARGLEVFYPHGDIQRPDSLALGLRQYAHRLKRWEDLRNNVCAAERASSSSRKPLSFGERRTFIHHALTSPLIFAGCGLSEVESTLWWLLATRARNCAKSVPLSQPLAYFLTADPLSLSLRARLEFTRCKSLHFRQHTDVWTFLVDLIDSLPEWRQHGENSRSNQPDSIRKGVAPKSFGRLKPNALWAAVRSAGLSDSSHDLSSVPSDERAFAIGAALKISKPVARAGETQKRGRRSRLATEFAQLAVVHGHFGPVVIEEFRPTSVAALPRQLIRRIQGLVHNDFNCSCSYVLVASKDAWVAIHDWKKLTAHLGKRYPHALIFGIHQLRNALNRWNARVDPAPAKRRSERGLNLDFVRRVLEHEPLPAWEETKVIQSLRELLEAYGDQRAGKSDQSRRIRGLIDMLGWFDIALPETGPLPDIAWQEIMLRLQDRVDEFRLLDSEEIGGRLAEAHRGQQSRGRAVRDRLIDQPAFEAPAEGAKPGRPPRPPRGR